MKNTHLFIGILGLIAFAATGQYMDIIHNHLVGMDDAVRLKYRSVHIYLFFSAIINIMLGLYWKKVSGTKLSLLQMLSSSIFFILPIIFLASFFRDIPLPGIERPLSRIGIYLALAASILAVISVYFETSSRKT